MNDVIQCLEVLIKWAAGIVKWSLITAVVFSILLFALVGVAHTLKANNIRINKFKI